MPDDFRDLIAARRDGLTHSQADLEQIAQSAAKGSVPDYQLAAWLMAAYLKPLTREETTWLTLAMANSGERLHLGALPKPWVDKHSTGGVGDKTSTVLLPLLAACGVTIVKMSGPGLGITGGTVDKLQSIPGFRMELSPEELIAQASSIGIAITGQTPDLAPADKALYTLRDATATTQSIPLIVSSILSKKIAGAAETIVLDVKCGSGGFMKTLAEAEELADWLLQTGKECGLNIRIGISDMSQPLGSAVGNALEVSEALDVLTKRPEVLPGPTRRFRQLCLHFAGEVIAATGLAESEAKGQSFAEEALASGKAAAKAAQWIAAQGGPSGLDLTRQALPKASITRRVLAPQSGYIHEVNAATVGITVVELGGGRKQKGDKIDPSVGVLVHASIGDKVSEGDAIFSIFASTEQRADEATVQLRNAFRLSIEQLKPPDLILRQYV